MPSITNLGHQTWCIHGSNADVLVDPVITRSFGSRPELQFEIWPPREIDVDALSAVNLIALTNEHLDHFHIPSLGALSSQVANVLVPPLFPTCASDVLESLGYDVIRADRFSTDDLELRFLSPAASEVPVWESRCASLLARHNERGTSCLIQSDTLLPESSGLAVDIFVATNNSQVRPPGWEGLGLTNMLDGDSLNILDRLQELGSVYSERLTGCRYVTFSGGGYRSVPRLHEPFALPDSVTVAKYLNESAVEKRFIGLEPGDTLHPDGSVTREPWVRPCAPLVDEPTVQPEADGTLIGLDLPAFLDSSAKADTEIINQLLDGLRPLERMIVASEFGNALVDANVWMGTHRDRSQRFAIHTRTSHGDHLLRFDIGENRFIEEPFHGELGELIREFPFGITAWASDITAMLQGEVQPWEIFSVGVRQWYALDPFHSPAAFFYAALSETVAPWHASTVYRNVTERISA